MSRAIQHLCRSRLWPIVAVVALCLGSLLPTWAGSYTYVSSQRTVNAGVLINGSASSITPDPAPYLFYVLNQRPDVKPFGWSIVNPRAPSAINNDIKARWGSYTVGQPVFPNMAAYWEVPLKDVSADQLSQYDVLYLPITGGSFAAVDNEKLRRFVDAGGTLLIDYSAASPAPPFGLFADITFSAGSLPLGLPQDGAPLTLRHPLLTRPYFLSADDILSLGTTSSGSLTAAVTGDFTNLFAPVINHPNSSTAISVSSLGAGQIIASGLNIGAAIYGSENPYYGSLGTSPDPSPLYTYAPAQDLRFLSNAISLVDMHPAESKSGHQNGVNNDLPSFAPAWTYPVSGTQIVPRSAAVWGGYAFVTDAAGILHAFDAFPSEDLTGSGKPDDGLLDYSTTGTPYDEIWNVSVGINASAPTVGVLKGVTAVFVEKADGSVTGYDPVTGGVSVSVPAPSTASNFGGYTPAPTVYGGRIYAGQSNGALFVYDPNSSSSANSGVLVPTADGSAIAASPTVGLIADGTANDIVSLVTSGQNISTVLLGARGDVLSPYPTTAPQGYSINRFKYGKQTLFVDAASVPPSVAFNDAGVSVPASGTSTVSTPDFTGAGTGTFYGDWDVNFASSLTAPGANLDLNQISLSSYGAITNSIGVTSFASPSAMDRNGDFYYRDIAVGGPGAFSYIIGVHNNVQFQNVQMKWRFRLPQNSDNITDADGVNYNLLDGFTFVGAPVADAQGYVYAIAYSQSQQKASVLCFVANGDVYADLPGGFDASRATFEQPDEFYATLPNQLRPGPTNPNLTYGQFTATGTRVTFYNFAVGTLGIRQLAGNLSEPQPVTIIPPLDVNGTTTTSQQPATIPLHTNLAWYTIPFNVNGSPAPISEVGNKLYFADASNLYSLPASPASITGKIAAVAPKIEYAHNVGLIAAAPSVGQGAMVLNGEHGIAAFTQQVTLITDNNRILETDFDGNALWAVDSTNLPIPATATQAASTTKVDFSHPTSISAVTANDYLVADTGNNRCVRFDRAGNVLWELTRFYDTSGLLSIGAPTTISQPSSVQMRRYLDTDPSNPNGFKESYLVADSGNFRVIEVTDTFNSQGVLIRNHVLTFVTHTADQSNRHYRYTSAAYFGPAGEVVLALVSNIRVALNATGKALASASGDAPGGSILVFDATSGSATLGNVTAGYTSFLNNGQTLPMRHPRFFSVYTSPSATGQPYSFLYADDNGAFDLSYNGTAFTTTPGSLAFGVVNYQSMVLPINSAQIINGVLTPPAPTRTILPFVPTCVQRIGTATGNIPRYLITQSHSQGELGDPGSTNIGGEIFEVDGAATPVGLYSGGTLSRPALTGPLTQPTYAIVP